MRMRLPVLISLERSYCDSHMSHLNRGVAHQAFYIYQASPATQEIPQEPTIPPEAHSPQVSQDLARIGPRRGHWVSPLDEPVRHTLSASSVPLLGGASVRLVCQSIRTATLAAPYQAVQDTMQMPRSLPPATQSLEYYWRLFEFHSISLTTFALRRRLPLGLAPQVPTPPPCPRR